MIKKFIRGYVKKHFADEVYFKDELNDTFNDIRKSEEKIQREFWEHEMDVHDKQVERVHFLETEKLKNEIESLQSEIKFYKVRQTQIEALEHHVTHKAQECVALVTGALMRINSLRDTFADHSGTMTGVLSDLEGVYLSLGSDK